ncbi:hypothetical protein FOZ61_010868, partial [Perkinsus olseni]
KVKEIASTVKVRTNALDEVTNLLVADLEAREEQLPPGDSEELAHSIGVALEEVREEVLELWGPEIEFDVVERGMHEQFENLKIYLALELRARSEDPGDVRAIRTARKGVRAQLWASVYPPFAINLADSFVGRIARRKCELVREESREVEFVRDEGWSRPIPSPPVYQQAEGDQFEAEPMRVAEMMSRLVSRGGIPVGMTEGSEAKITDDGQGLLKEGIVHKDSYWITLCRVGLTNELIKKLSCLSAVRTWEEWSENVEQMAGDDAAGGRVLEVLGVSASNAGGTLNSGTGNDATRGRGDGKGPAEFRGKQGG